jgi:predicted transcriptional regulator
MGCVTRDRRPAAHAFQAAVGRQDIIGRRLQAVAEQLCGGSLTPLLTHLVRARRLSAQERRDLRGLIDELDRQNKGKADGR